MRENITEEGVRIEIDTEQFEFKLYKAFDSYTRLLERQFTQEISKKQFYWPNETLRGGKSEQFMGGIRNVFKIVPAGNRDIVDTGAFRQSIQRRNIDGANYRFTWDVPYSIYILKGYRTPKGRQMPPRNWISKALTKIPPITTLQKLLNRP